MAKKILTSLQKLAIAAAGLLLAFGTVTPITAHAARTDALWDYIQGGNYTKPNGSANGTDILIFGSNHYLNFGAVTGTNGYGIRDNAGTIECKSSGGAWASCTGGGGGVTSVTGTYPIVSSGGTTPALSLAFGTTTANIWQLTQTNTVAPIFSSLTGVLKGNGSSALTVAANGTDYSLITALTCGASNHFSGVTAAGVFTCTADSGGGSGVGTVATSSLETAGQIPYWTTTSGYPAKLTSIATSTPTIGSVISYTGTLGNFIGGTSGTFGIANNAITVGMLAQAAANTVLVNTAGATGNISALATSTFANGLYSGTAGQVLYRTSAGTWVGTATSTDSCGTGVTCSYSGGVNTFSIANSAITNAMLANSTISGVSLGGTLAALTATNATLTFSGSYTGTAAQTVGLNLANSNNWTASRSAFGSTTPLATLSIGTTTSASPNLPLFAISSSTQANILSITGYGNVLINTSSANSAGDTLNVQAQNDAQDHQLEFNCPASGKGCYNKLSANSLFSSFEIAASDGSGADWKFGLFGSTAFSVADNGTNIFSIAKGAPANVFTISSLGNVGIGSTTPGSLFSIGGNGTGWNFFDNATSTKSGVGGINIATGCYAVNGVCLSAASGGTFDQQTYTATSSSPFTWTKPAGGHYVHVQCWGGGGSGASSGSTLSAVAAGGGGAYKENWFLASSLGATETVTLGVGGARVSPNSAGNTGGNSTFGAWLTAWGGAGGPSPANSAQFGGNGGGGDQAAGGIGAGVGLNTTVTPVAVIFGGGAGGGSASGGVGVQGGGSWWGGAGGGNGNNGTAGAGGVSVMGGQGGAASVTLATPGSNGTQPGGGGGTYHVNGGGQLGGGGGDGECIVTTT